MQLIRAFVTPLILALLLSSVSLNPLNDTDTTETPPFSGSNASLVIQSPAAGNWHIETVDSEGRVGQYTSLALGKAGRPHISYHAPGPRSPPPPTNGYLKYAWYDGATWQIETVESEGGAYTSLVLDGPGRPHISYHEYLHGDLKYAWHDGTDWHIKTADSEGIVGSEGWVGWHTSLALDGLGRPHISYHALSPPPPLQSTVVHRPHSSHSSSHLRGELKYAWHDGTEWHMETVDSEGYGGGYTSLALDGSDRSHISYYDETNDALKYAWHDGTVWHIEVIDSGGGVYTSLALDRSDQPHISYYDDTTRALKYAWRDGTGWQIETVDSEGGAYTSLALDGSDRPHISYHGDKVLKYAWRGGTDWHIETVDSKGRHTSLALDESDQPYISYYDDTNDDLKYARLMPSPLLHKQATPSDGLRNNDTLTYTLTLSGPGLSVRLWDPLPANVHYITASITPPAVYSPTVRAIVWQGTLPTDTVQVVRFQVTPGITGTGALSLSQPIVNTAWLTDTYSGFGVSATVIVNGQRIYLPLVLRQSP